MKSKESPEVWTTPELITLVRNKPEETVLSTCKSATKGASYGMEHDRCEYALPICTGCSGLAGS
jgi:hypothetical protein